MVNTFNFFIILLIFSIGISFEQAWAQDTGSMGKGFFEDPVAHFSDTEGGVLKFLLFIIGIATYALFVWYFYRFISKRDVFPKIFYKLSKQESASKARLAIGVASYIVLFPIIIFVWFTVLSFFVYLIGEDMPLFLAIFVSMSIIAVVRILSYYREDAAKEIAKMIPYAILAFFLTSAAVYNNPNFFTEKEFASVPGLFVDHLESIVFAVVLVSIFEYSFRIAFIIKRRYRPVADKILEDEIQKEVEEITNAHYKKIENKEKELEKKLEEMLKKLKDSKN